jgi:nucleoside-diphosphate-sugar epimerase
MKPKILVTGASGFIGCEVSRRLVLKDCRPRFMVRDLLQDRCVIRHPEIEMVIGDLQDDLSLNQAVKGVDAVIHLGAKATFESYASLKPTIFDGSVTLMKAAAKNGVKAFVYSSSLLVYGDNRSQVDEKTIPRPVLDYGRIKLDTERELAMIAASSGIAFSAIRLPHVYGAMDLYFQQIRQGLLILPGLGKNIFSHLHVADTAKLLIACAQQGFCGILPVGDDLPATWSEFLTLVRRHHAGARVLVLPEWLALAAAYAIAPVRRFRPHPGLETPGAIRSYNCNIAVKPGLMFKDLGLSPSFPTIHEGVPAVAKESLLLKNLLFTQV